eukprot:scaffold426754_cov43-Prasinocladus_malaysianus.AAC.1
MTAKARLFGAQATSGLGEIGETLGALKYNTWLAHRPPKPGLHTLTVLSFEADASQSPLGAQGAEMTPSWWPSRANRPSLRPQTLTAGSYWDAVDSLLPLPDHPSQEMLNGWASTSRGCLDASRVPVPDMYHTTSCPLVDPPARR